MTWLVGPEGWARKYLSFTISPLLAGRTKLHLMMFGPGSGRRLTKPLNGIDQIGNHAAPLRRNAASIGTYLREQKDEEMARETRENTRKKETKERGIQATILRAEENLTSATAKIPVQQKSVPFASFRLFRGQPRSFTIIMVST